MISRQLGRHDVRLSVLGMGGIVVSKVEQSVADRRVAETIDRGVNYFDVAPQYADAEERLGPALRPYRDGVTLACKTLQRSGAEATAELERSLTRLQTDRFDIYQLHAMTTAEDADEVLGPGGALEAVVKAREQGKVRLIGFSAHDEATALRLIETGAFDTVLYPLNAVAYEAGVFGPGVLAAANERGMGVMALKAMARGRVESWEDRPYPKCWYQPEDRPEVARLLLRYTLNLPGVTAAIPPGEPALFEMALDAVDRGLEPLSEEEQAGLMAALGADLVPIFPAPEE
ncbi:MAG: aldo/keto reductase [Planctomycetota bacterium]